LKALTHGWLKASQLEAVRRVIIRNIRKIGKIWIRVFAHKPISQKPTKTRMGKGKGSVQFWVCPVSPGRILFEIKGGITESVAKNVLIKASQKLPILTKFVTYKSSSYINKTR
jgi:large subunit ribosomal protein L16